MRPSYRIANLQEPRLSGGRALILDLAFGGVTAVNGVISGDLVQEIEAEAIDFVQSLFIDNSLNPSPLVFTIANGSANGQIIRAAPFSQGVYEVTPEAAPGFRFTAQTQPAITISVLAYNIAMPYYTYRVASGLTHQILEFAPLAIGDNTIVAAVAGKRIYVYRLLLDVSGATNIKFFDGPSASNLPLTGTLPLTGPGASMMLPPTGYDVPWFQTSSGNALVMTSSAAVNMGGIVDFVQI